MIILILLHYMLGENNLNDHAVYLITGYYLFVTSTLHYPKNTSFYCKSLVNLSIGVIFGFRHFLSSLSFTYSAISIKAL